MVPIGQNAHHVQHFDGPQRTVIFTHAAGDAARLIYGSQFL